MPDFQTLQEKQDTPKIENVAPQEEEKKIIIEEEEQKVETKSKVQS